jgi:hypothetical protein
VLWSQLYLCWRSNLPPSSNQMFITVPTTATHWSLCLVLWIQWPIFEFVSLKLILTLPSNPLSIRVSSLRVSSPRAPQCLATGPQQLPQPVRHTVRSSASSINLQYNLLSCRSSSGCLLLLPHLPVTYILPSIFPSVTCFRRQCPRKTWPIQSAYLLFALCTKFLSSLPHTIGPTDFHPSPAPHFKNYQVFMIYFFNKIM